MQLIAPRQQVTPFAAYYKRLRQRGMPGHAAVGHLAGKVISVLFFCLRSGQPYDPMLHARALGYSDAKIVVRGLDLRQECGALRPLYIKRTQASNGPSGRTTDP